MQGRQSATCHQRDPRIQISCLSSTIIFKTHIFRENFPSASYPAEVISAHDNADTPKTISVSNNERFHLARVPRPSKYTNSKENSIPSRTCDFIGYEQFYGQHCYIYNRSNDRGNSRNSEENSIPSRVAYMIPLGIASFTDSNVTFITSAMTEWT